MSLSLDSIEQAFEPLKDLGQASHMQAYMLNQFAFLGIRAGPRRQALRAVWRTRTKAQMTTRNCLALAKQLWKKPEREFQYAAVDILDWQHHHLNLAHLPQLLALVQHKSWWDSVDGLAGVIGDVVLQCLPDHPDAQIHMDECIQHPNMWVRRVAMLHQLGWKTQTDEERLFEYALSLADEKEFFIRKAIGWALRDHARTRPHGVRAFLKKHQQVLSGLTVREAGKHL
jgi:3-methyladenine DNA glycosylase AlkD